MLSWEINQVIVNNNYSLTHDEYVRISDTNISPQINMIKYNAFDDVIEMTTDDGWYWRFKIKEG